jgi:hypothetical protein
MTLSGVGLEHSTGSGQTFRFAQNRPFDLAQDRPFDLAQDRLVECSPEPAPSLSNGHERNPLIQSFLGASGGFSFTAPQEAVIEIEPYRSRI